MESVEVMRIAYDISGYKLSMLKALVSAPSMTNWQFTSQLDIPYYLVNKYVQHLYQGGLLTKRRFDKRIHYSLKDPQHVRALLNDLEVLSHDCD